MCTGKSSRGLAIEDECSVEVGSQELLPCSTKAHAPWTGEIREDQRRN